MNCFAHALPFLDDPYFAVGSCVPDWLGACDRKCRAREKNAIALSAHDDVIVRSVALGVAQHHFDDGWFHRTPAFNELMLGFSVELRELLGNERSMRPGLIGHILVEMFLDAHLHAENPGMLDCYYERVESVDPVAVQNAINLFATRPTSELVAAIERFARIRFLFDYETDEGILYRCNRVLERVRLEPLPDSVLAWMSPARQRVYNRSDELLAGRSPGEPKTDRA